MIPGIVYRSMCSWFRMKRSRSRRTGPLTFFSFRRAADASTRRRYRTPQKSDKTGEQASRVLVKLPKFHRCTLSDITMGVTVVVVVVVEVPVAVD